MGKTCIEKAELKKGPWTREEDQKLLAYIQEHGHGSWRTIPDKAGLERCGKSCRLRWTNYLRPDIKRGKFSSHEEKTIIQLHALLGNRWSAIAMHLPNRTDNEIKNYWNTRLKKRLTRMGIDPTTHMPKNGSGQSKEAANLSHMAQWESARLEAETRLGRESKLLYNLQLLHNTAIMPQLAPALPPLPPATRPCLDVLKVWQRSSWSKPTNENSPLSPNYFFTSNGNLESPTSTLSFSKNMSTIPFTRCDTNSIPTNVVPFENRNLNKNFEVKGIMDNSNSMQLHDTMAYNMGSNDHMALSNDFLHFSNISNATGDLEDSRNFWSEILDFVNSPPGSAQGF